MNLATSSQILANIAVIAIIILQLHCLPYSLDLSLNGFGLFFNSELPQKTKICHNRVCAEGSSLKNNSE